MNVKKTLTYNDLLKSCDIALSVVIERSLLKGSLKFGNKKNQRGFFTLVKNF